MPASKSNRPRFLDTLPRWLMGVVLHVDRLYRKLSLPLRYHIHRNRARRMLGDLVKQSSVNEVHIEATNICNAACKFCAYRVMERPKGVMGLSDFRRYVDQIMAAGIRIFDLTAIVGDPFTDRLVFDRLEILKAHQADTINLTTNAIAMQPDKVDDLVAFVRSFSGTVVIRVSFGGFDRNTYREIFQVDRFERVVRNLDYLIGKKTTLDLRSLDLELHVRCPLSRLRGETYQKFLEYESRGWLSIHRRLNRDLRYGNWGGKIPARDIESVGLKAAPTPKKFYGPCDLMFSGGVIVTMDGEVNACACRDVDVSLPIGNLNDMTFKDILRGKKRYELMISMMENRIPKFCRGCSEYRSIFSPDAEFYRHLVRKMPARPERTREDSNQTRNASQTRNKSQVRNKSQAPNDSARQEKPVLQEVNHD
jgi:sulfatase maturation enzyme AslB (radical SAM superfamily)